MTVCIAAIGDGRSGERKIVVCCDALGSSSLGTRDLVIKDRPVGHNWRCLTAGSIDEINATVPLIAMEIRKLAETDETNVVSALRSALQQRKDALADELTLGLWAMTYGDFRKARSQFPDDIYRDHLEAIRRIQLNAEFIVTGYQMFQGKSYGPMLLQVQSDWKVTVQEDYAVIGEGSYLAQSSLMHRGVNDARPLDEVIYCAYEAKKAAERVRSVGDFTGLCVYHPDGTQQTLDITGKVYLDQKVIELGPRDIPASMDISSKLIARPRIVPLSPDEPKEASE